MDGDRPGSYSYLVCGLYYCRILILAVQPGTLPTSFSLHFLLVKRSKNTYLGGHYPV